MAYEAEAAQVAGALKKIVATVKETGGGTIMVMSVLSTLMGLTTVLSAIKEMDDAQRKLFVAEVFDACIGEEETALVNQLGPLNIAGTEKVADALKEIFVQFVHPVIEPPPSSGPSV